VRLLSVNVGTPRTVQWHGRQVTTAIFKHPADGPRFVGRINVEGDHQADRAAHSGGPLPAPPLPGVLAGRVSADRVGRRLQDLAGFGHGGVVGVHIDPSDDAVRVGDDDGGHGQCGGPVRVDLGQVQAQL